MQNRTRTISWIFLVTFSLLIQTFFLLISKLNIGYPIVDFMLSPVGRFDDFRNPLIYAPQVFESHIGVGFTPLQALIYQILSWFPFYAGLLISSLIPLLAIYSGTRKSGLATFTFSIAIGLYPILFCLARGNNDIWVFALLLFFYKSLSLKKHKAAGVFLGIAASIDPLFSIFALLYIKPFCILFWRWFISTCSTLFILPCLLYGANPILELRLLIDQFFNYRIGMVAGDAGLLFSNALSGALKGLYYIQNSAPIPMHTLNLILQISNLLGVLILCFVLFQLRSLNYSHQLSRVFLNLVALLVLFGSASPDYKLIFFLIPLLVDWNKSLNGSFALGILFVILFLPKHFIWYQFDFNPVGFTLNSLVNPLLSICIVVFMAVRFQKKAL